MKQLKNLDHSFDLNVSEIGVTIRMGDKWRLPKGEVFLLVEQYSDGSRDRMAGSGVAVDSWCGAFEEIPDSLVALEHNKSARDKTVLFGMMKAGYGEQFDETSIVTAFTYRRLVKSEVSE